MQPLPQPHHQQTRKASLELHTILVTPNVTVQVCSSAWKKCTVNISSVCQVIVLFGRLPLVFAFCRSVQLEEAPCRCTVSEHLAAVRGPQVFVESSWRVLDVGSEPRPPEVDPYFGVKRKLVHLVYQGFQRLLVLHCLPIYLRTHTFTVY